VRVLRFGLVEWARLITVVDLWIFSYDFVKVYLGR